MGNEVDENTESDEQVNIAEHIDALLETWRSDFELEAKLKAEVWAVFGKLEASKTRKIRQFINAKSKCKRSTTEYHDSLTATTVTQDTVSDVTARFEQKMQIQQAEIANCELNSTTASTGKGGSNTASGGTLGPAAA